MNPVQSKNPIRICQVVASINPGTGGPAVSVTRLSEELVKLGADCRLVALDYPEHGAVKPGHSVNIELHGVDFLARRFRGWSPGFQRRLAYLATQTDVVHNHGLWMFPNKYAGRSALRARVPLVISPRGMLEPWSRNRSRWKKAVVWWAWERANLKNAAWMHATSLAEMEALRAMGLHQPVAVIPNGVDACASGPPPERSVLEARFPDLVGRRWLLFMSRLHAKKGLSELLEAWRGLASHYPEWQLVIAGQDLDGYGEIARQQAASLGLARRITWTGMLSGADKYCALNHAELFVLPSHSENFGIAIAEALAHGLPVITTHGTPWSEIVRDKCGWWIEIGAEALISTLHTALGTATDGLVEMGERGRKLVTREYSWESAAQRMLAVYLWQTQGGDRPDCLHRFSPN